MTQKASADHILRVLLIGNSSVGKTCILKRFSDEEFDPNFITTIGVDFKIKTLDYHGKSVQLQVWDTAGQERFQSITKTYYRYVVRILIPGLWQKCAWYEDLGQTRQKDYQTFFWCLFPILSNFYSFLTQIMPNFVQIRSNCHNFVPIFDPSLSQFYPNFVPD